MVPLIELAQGFALALSLLDFPSDGGQLPNVVIHRLPIMMERPGMPNTATISVR